MLNFRNTNLFFIVLLIIAVGYNLMHPLPWTIYLLVVLAYSLLIFYGSYVVSSNFFLRIICAAETDKKEIAISFDDGPAPMYTSQILKLLLEFQVKAAFFCIGKNIAGNEALLAQVHQQGHIIGNHSFSHHFWFDLFSTKKMVEDLQAMDDALDKVTGLKPRLFRPPYGVTNPNLRRAIELCKYIPVGWNVRSLDTVIHDEKKLLAKVINKVKPGAILLFHDTSKTTLAILPAFFQQVARKGYTIVRLDKLLKIEPYA